MKEEKNKSKNVKLFENEGKKLKKNKIVEGKEMGEGDWDMLFDEGKGSMDDLDEKIEKKRGNVKKEKKKLKGIKKVIKEKIRREEKMKREFKK